jgi:sugar diacid utilization regulator
MGLDIRDAAGEDGTTVGDVMVALERAADDGVAAACSGYEDAQRQAIRRQEARRREFVDELLAGTGDPDRLVQMASGFGFNLSRIHVVALARTDRAVVDAGPVQGRLEREVLSRIGERDVLVATKEGDLVCVFPGDLADPIPGLFDMLQAAEPGPWRVSVGAGWPGPGGVARSFRDAMETLAVALRLAADSPIVRAEEWEAHRLLVRDREALARLTSGVVDRLAAARGGAEPLLLTLEAFFAENGNVTAMGRRLHLSPRAVSYRLAAIERLTGLSPQDPGDRFTLETAVIGHRLLADHP